MWQLEGVLGCLVLDNRCTPVCSVSSPTHMTRSTVVSPESGNSAGRAPAVKPRQARDTGIQKPSITDGLQTYAWPLIPAALSSASDRRIHDVISCKEQSLEQFHTAAHRPGSDRNYQHLASSVPPGIPSAQARPGGACLQWQGTPGVAGTGAQGNSIYLLSLVRPQSALQQYGHRHPISCSHSF